MPQLPPIRPSSSTITGEAPTGSSTPPSCAAAERWTRSPTWAQLPTSSCESTSVPAPHQRVRVHQRAVAHPGAGVDEHGRHADHPAAQVAAVADRRAAGHHSHAVSDHQWPGRIGRLVEKGEPDAVLATPERHIHDLAHAETGEDSLLDPEIHPPAGGRLGIGLGRPDLPAVERLLELLEERALRKAINGRRLGIEAFDVAAKGFEIPPEIKRQAGPPPPAVRTQGSRVSIPNSGGSSRSSPGSPA